MSHRARSILFAGGEIVSFLWAAYSLVRDYGGFSSSIDWRLSALAALFIFFVIVIFHVSYLNGLLTSKMPNVVVAKREGFDNPYTNFVQMSSVRETQLTESGRVAKVGVTTMAHVKFANNPKNPTDLNDAIDVRGELSYFDIEESRVVGTIEARWGDKDQPSPNMTPQQRREILHMNLQSSGNWRGMDIAMRYMGEEDWYAYNNDSYRRDDFRLETLKLPLVDKLHVRVDLYGKIFKHKRFWLTLYRLGQNDWPNIRIEEGKN